jgi:hypothetical protein
MRSLVPSSPSSAVFLMLLVERIEDLGVGEDLVQALAGQHPGIVGKPKWELPHGAVVLDFLAALMQPGLAAAVDLFRKGLSLGGGHVILLCTGRGRARGPSAGLQGSPRRG